LSVEEEISEVEGVDAVSAELESGRVVVTGTDMDMEAIRAAVAEVGYEVVS
jgi:copper chaperone CopZ